MPFGNKRTILFYSQQLKNNNLRNQFFNLTETKIVYRIKLRERFINKIQNNHYHDHTRIFHILALK